MSSTDGWHNLAIGIVKQAAVDYERLLCGENVTGYPCLKVNKTEIENFFRSEYFMLLSDTTGESFIQMLRDDAKKCGYDWAKVRALHNICDI